MRELADDTALVGRELCRAYSDLVDGWLAELFAAGGRRAGADGVALVAVGGYGRAELSLQSDIDVLLLHGGRSDIGTLADGLWYPIWDEGLKLGHAVRTIREALALASDDLDTATSLLQVRHLAGDEDLTDELAGRALDQWQKRSKRWLADLSTRGARPATSGRARWPSSSSPTSRRAAAACATSTPCAGPRPPAACCGRATTRALVDGLPRPCCRPGSSCTAAPSRPGDRLLLEEQDAVAAALRRRPTPTT